MSETRSSHVPSNVRGVQRYVLLPAMLLASASVLLLSGCSSSFKPGLASSESAQAEEHTAKGRVHGGQFPVAGSTVNVYAAATGSYGAASTLQTTGTAPTTNATGGFNISYHCTPGQELYLVATGGDPLNDNNQATETNAGLALMAPMGPCGNLFTGISGSFNITEVTTVAFAYSVGQFANGYLNIGAPSTNSAGLANAFLTTTNLVNLTTGTALSVTPAYPLPSADTPPSTTPPDTFSSVVPADAINSIANSLANCVNTINSGTTLSAQCSNPSGPTYGLFDYTGGGQSLQSGSGVNNSPNAGTTLNTADAALYIAHNPGLPVSTGLSQGTNIAAFLALGGATPPFPSPVLTGTPGDLSLTVQYVGGGMGGASSASTTNSSYLAIDANNDIWVVNPLRKTVSEFNNLGAPLTSNTVVVATGTHGLTSAGGYVPGFTSAASAQSLAVDLSGNVWIADSSSNCLVGLSSSGTPLQSAGANAGLCPTMGAHGVAVDPSNNLWVASAAPYVFEAVYSGGTVSYGGSLTPNPYSSGMDVLTGYIQADESGNVWFADENNNMETLPTFGNSSNGILTEPTIFGAMGPYTGTQNNGGGLAVFLSEGTGGVDAVNITGATNTEPQPFAFTPESTVNLLGEAVDGNGNVYIVSGTGNDVNGVTVPANVTVYAENLSTEVSPYNNGYAGASGFVGLTTPKGIAIDQSGNVWVVSNGNHTAHLNVGPYAGLYDFTSGLQASNLVEYIGLAVPVNPVLAGQAKAGDSAFAGGSPTAAGSYGHRP